jgi:hypothetical protein
MTIIHIQPFIPSGLFCVITCKLDRGRACGVLFSCPTHLTSARQSCNGSSVHNTGGTDIIYRTLIKRKSCTVPSVCDQKNACPWTPHWHLQRHMQKHAFRGQQLYSRQYPRLCLNERRTLGVFGCIAPKPLCRAMPPAPIRNPFTP